MVLTVDPRAYVARGTEQIESIPGNVHVKRVFALDAARHLSIRGWYPGFLSIPDRWASWFPLGVVSGRRLIRKYKPDVIFSTYPIATAHRIALQLAEWSGLPWVADFRDPMYDDQYPTVPRQREINAELERKVVERSEKCIVTTRLAKMLLEGRYPEMDSRFCAVIPNGFAEEDFPPSDRQRVSHTGQKRPLTLLHSGVLYPVERDPLPFFRALRALKAEGKIASTKVKIRLRATAHDEHYRIVLADLGIDDLVEIVPALPYSAALREMTEADALLLFQGTGCNHQVPAKLYEYLRAQRPIIALTDPIGETAGVLREAGADNLLPLSDEAAIVDGLPTMLERLNQDSLYTVPSTVVARYSRAQGTADLAAILDEVAA